MASKLLLIIQAMQQLLAEIAEAEAAKPPPPKPPPKPPPAPPRLGQTLYTDLRTGERFTRDADGRRRPVPFIPYGYTYDPEDGGWWRPW
jgi:hypothetical protein